ncbi:hypothetical protein ACJJTC_003024 [Scirpophaga incertulas]
MATIFNIVFASALLVQSVLGSLLLPPQPHHGLSAASAAAAAAAAAGHGGGAAASAAAAAAAAASASAAGVGAPLLALPDLTKVVYSGPLLVTSVSPIAPTGLSVTSENVLEGLLEVKGILPFASAVAFEGSLETAGSGAANCGCGSKSIGLLEVKGILPFASAVAFEGSLDTAGSGAASCGCGSGSIGDR